MMPKDAPIPPRSAALATLPETGATVATAPQDAPAGLSAETITLAYQLFLGRNPERGRIAALQNKAVGLEELRHMMLTSREFAKAYAQLPAPKIPAAAPRPAPRPAGMPTIVHLHIPKTAGTSLNKMLLRLYAPDERMDAHGGDPTRRLRAMTVEERSQLKLLAGHCVYGVDELLSPPALYLCILRHPGERILSYYRFIMRTKTPPHLEELVAQKPDFGTFLMLAEKTPGLAGELDNGQVRRISGKMWAPTVTQDIYNEAVANLESDHMIYGLTERFDLFLAELKAREILDDTQAEYANSAPNRVDFAAVRNALTPEQKAKLAAFTRWDNCLYAHCTAALAAAHPL